MKFSLSTLLILATPLLAWEFDPEPGPGGRPKVFGREDQECTNVARRWDAERRFEWRPDRDTSPDAKCCVYLYRERDCSRNSRGFAIERMCRPFEGRSKKPFESFQVLCTRRDSWD
jgi:hypothetical protein